MTLYAWQNHDGSLHVSSTDAILLMPYKPRPIKGLRVVEVSLQIVGDIRDDGRNADGSMPSGWAERVARGGVGSDRG